MSGEVWVVRDPVYGDNGKAKIVDYLTGDKRVAAVVRWQGGDNAGHTVVVDGKKIAVHALPCGVIRAQERPLKSVMGRGMVVSLPRLFAEIDALASKGIKVTPDNLLISEGAQLTFPYHVALEQARERRGAKRGTTAKGIGPTYATSCLYQKVMACDVRNLDVVRKRIEEPSRWAASILRDQYDEQEIFPDETTDEVRRYRDRLLPFLGNEILFLNELLEDGGVIICEGAQGGMLDRDLGIRGGTASHTWTGSIQSGCGIDPRRWVTRDIAVVKAYTSRVGMGHFVPEIHGPLADRIREVGNEYGTTTGRPRQVGWPDSVVGRFCAMVGRPTELAITKADVLTGIHPLLVCTDYQRRGNVVPIFPTDDQELGECSPVYREFPGWEEDIAGATCWDQLPETCRRYLQAVAYPYRAPITLVGTGPGREHIIVR